MPKKCDTREEVLGFLVHEISDISSKLEGETGNREVKNIFSNIYNFLCANEILKSGTTSFGRY